MRREMKLARPMRLTESESGFEAKVDFRPHVGKIWWMLVLPLGFLVCMPLLDDVLNAFPVVLLVWLGLTMALREWKDRLCIRVDATEGVLLRDGTELHRFRLAGTSVRVEDANTVGEYTLRLEPRMGKSTRAACLHLEDADAKKLQDVLDRHCERADGAAADGSVLP